MSCPLISKEKLQYAIKFLLDEVKKNRENEDQSSPVRTRSKTNKDGTEIKPNDEANGRKDSAQSVEKFNVNLASKSLRTSHLGSFKNFALEAVRTFVITHRWRGALALVPGLIEQTYLVPIVVWKVGSLVLLNHPHGNFNYTCNFANTMISVVKNSSKPEIILDHLTYLFSHGHIKEAQLFVDSSLIERHRSNSYITAVYFGYRALLEYNAYLSYRKTLQTTEEHCTSKAMMEYGCQSQYKKTVGFFGQAIKTNGNHDLVIEKYVELLESNNELDKVLDVLMDYIKKNKHHPSPYWYLYQFLRRHSINADVKINMLKKVVSLSPSASGCLQLLELLQDKEPSYRLKLLANTIDYSHCRNDSSLWQKFADLLMSINDIQDDKFVKKLGKICKDRMSWWSGYHFKKNELGTVAKDVRKLVTCKAAVATFIYGTDYPYTEVVRNELRARKRLTEIRYLDEVKSVVSSVRQLYIKDKSRSKRKKKKKAKVQHVTEISAHSRSEPVSFKRRKKD